MDTGREMTNETEEEEWEMVKWRDTMDTKGRERERERGDGCILEKKY